MATLKISNVTETTANWTISGLSYDFKNDKYVNAGLTTQNFDEGINYLDSTKILEPMVFATSSLQFANNTVSGTITGLTPGKKYTVYAFTKTLDLKFWHAGSDEFTTLSSGGGGETGGAWTCTSLDTIINNAKKGLFPKANICYCYPITFTYSGTATFYSVNRLSNYALDLVAYLSTSPPSLFDDNEGAPSSYDYYSDDTDEYYDDNQIYSDFGFQHYVIANNQYYLYVRHRINNDTTNGFAYINVVAPTETENKYFEWSSAVAQGLSLKNVSHTEWDSFIDKIIEVLTAKGIQNQLTEEKYGYLIGTTYSTMLQDCYMAYNVDLGGYPLTAQMFNIARFIIGSHVETGIEDKTSYMSKVLASDFIKLANCLKTWQG